MDVAWSALPQAAREKLLNAKSRGDEGILPFLGDLEEKRYKQYIRIFLRQYQAARECHGCHGTKLQPEALQVRVGGRNIAEIADLPIDRLSEWLATLPLTGFETAVAEHI